MTEKQRTFLSKYLTEKNIYHLEKKGFDTTSHFINLIIQTTNYEKYSMIPYFEVDTIYSEKILGIPYERIEYMEKYINIEESKKGKKSIFMDLGDDTYARITKICYLDTYHYWFKFTQTWYKGMSNTMSCYTYPIVFDEKDKFSGVSSYWLRQNIYNILLDMGIYTINQLLQFYANQNTPQYVEIK